MTYGLNSMCHSNQIDPWALVSSFYVMNWEQNYNCRTNWS
jgi:hypothetical protein